MTKLLAENEVKIIGYDFKPGDQANADIDLLLGYNTHMLDDQAVRSESKGCIFAPNYCEDIELVRHELEKLELDPLILPSIDFIKHKRNEEYPPMLIASFIYDGEHFITKPFDTAALALSCALWYVLAYHT